MHIEGQANTIMHACSYYTVIKYDSYNYAIKTKLVLIAIASFPSSCCMAI